jgi:hypothetical protein
MKRSITNDTKQNKKQKLLDLKDFKIDTFDIPYLKSTIQTPCNKFLIGIEDYSIVRYCLETKQKVRIVEYICEKGYKDGTRDESRCYCPTSLTLSKDLKTLFVSDILSYVIRAICVETGITKTFTGQVGKREHVDGPKEKVCFSYPRYLKLSPDGNTLYVADGKSIRTICVKTGQVDTMHTFIRQIHDVIISSDSKHIYICHWNKFIKFNLETGQSEIVLKGFGFNGCDISKDGQFLFIANWEQKYIQIFNLVTNHVIDTITTPFKPTKICILKYYQLKIRSTRHEYKTRVLDISKYCTNFKTFMQLQLVKHSFLPRQVIKRFN